MKYIVFDFDGTVHDTSEIYIKAFRFVEQELLNLGLITDKISDQTIKRFIGKTPKDMWAEYLPHIAFEDVSIFSKKIGEMMIQFTIKGYSKLYPNTHEVLHELKQKGYKMILLSNCKMKYMNTMIEKHNLHQYFDTIIAAEEFGFASKESIMKNIRSERNGEFVFVGDRQNDVELKEGTEISFGCMYGFGSLEELNNANYLIHSIQELGKYL